VLIGIGAVCEVSVELGSGEVEGDVALRDTGEILELSDEDTSDWLSIGGEQEFSRCGGEMATRGIAGQQGELVDVGWRIEKDGLKKEGLDSEDDTVGLDELIKGYVSSWKITSLEK